MNFDVCSIGELIMDCTTESSLNSDTPVFKCNPGGAPGNVAACLAKLGKRTTFIGKVGNDLFGSNLIKALGRAGVDTKGVISSNEYNTTLAFVYLTEDGNRSFSFYRKGCADVMLDTKEIDWSILENSAALHFGSVSMTQEPSRSATMSAVSFMKSAGRVVTYDPNYRESLWEDRDEAIEIMLGGMAYADIVKVADEELEILTGIKDVRKAADILMDRYDIKLMLATMGCRGAWCISRNHALYSATYDVGTVDTNGAGDASMGGLLYCMSELDWDFERLDENALEKCLKFSNASGALTTTRGGAIPAMPGLEEIERCLSNTALIK